MTELGWRWEALQVINAMEQTRQTNNIAWMDVLRLAVSHAPPSDVKKLFKTIRAMDYRIQELWTQLLEQIPD